MVTDLLGDFHKRDAELQRSTAVQINDSLDVCLCYDHFRNQDEKRIKVSLEFEITDTTLNKSEAEKLIQALQKLLNDL